MIQCSECEYYVPGPGGQAGFTCNPFSNIKEPECLTKWQLIKLDMQLNRINEMVRAYQQTLAYYHRLAPMQEKMMRHMEREIDDTNEADKWKTDYDDEEDDDNLRPDLP